MEQSVYQRSTLTADVLQSELEQFKQMADRPLTDDDCFLKLVQVVFYSGVKAETVNQRMDTIQAYLGDWQRTAAYEENDIEQMMADPEMLSNKRKIEGCVRNGRVFGDIVAKHGSFRAYFVAPCQRKHKLRLLQPRILMPVPATKLKKKGSRKLA